jgi:hypothetical protein
MAESHTNATNATGPRPADWGSGLKETACLKQAAARHPGLLSLAQDATKIKDG